MAEGIDVASAVAIGSGAASFLGLIGAITAGIIKGFKSERKEADEDTSPSKFVRLDHAELGDFESIRALSQSLHEINPVLLAIMESQRRIPTLFLDTMQNQQTILSIIRENKEVIQAMAARVERLEHKADIAKAVADDRDRRSRDL